ncbi:MAG: hypothetical protein KatS3mg108_2740 [Isosphaeraceae bacterium]|jgi:hypothetical protein|nr:MAG: hypothetical protein KatS3mg108_2740 [Isosphaeraceae bacterium]
MTFLNIESPMVFGVVATLLIGYILYMMIRRRKGLRPGYTDREPEI